MRIPDWVKILTVITVVILFVFGIAHMITSIMKAAEPLAKKVAVKIDEALEPETEKRTLYIEKEAFSVLDGSEPLIQTFSRHAPDTPSILLTETGSIECSLWKAKTMRMEGEVSRFRVLIDYECVVWE